MRPVLILPNNNENPKEFWLIIFLMRLLGLTLSARSQSLLPIKQAQNLISISQSAAREALKARIDAETFAFQLVKKDSITTNQARYINSLENAILLQKNIERKLKRKLIFSKIQTVIFATSTLFLELRILKLL